MQLKMGPNGKNLVNREADFGMINTGGGLAEYVAVVEACDDFEVPACSEQKVRLQIEDINDSAPIFWQGGQTKSSIQISVCDKVSEKYQKTESAESENDPLNGYYNLENNFRVIDLDDNTNSIPFKVSIPEDSSYYNTFKFVKIENFSDGGNYNIEEFGIYTNEDRLEAKQSISIDVVMVDVQGKSIVRNLVVSICK